MSNTNCPITDDDKVWIEDNFRWLLGVYGYPGRWSQQVLPTKAFFPETFSKINIEIEPVIIDGSRLLHLDHHKIRYELRKDIRDSTETPYEFQGLPFESELCIESSESQNNYRIHIAHSLQKHPDRLVFTIVLNLIKIRLIENRVEFDSGEDSDLFIYLAGIYFGFGIILAQSLLVSGSQLQGGWEYKWNFVSPMPEPVLAYALALYESLLDRPSPEWKDFLPAGFRKTFTIAAEFIRQNPSELFNKRELGANDLCMKADQLYAQNNFDEAITELQKALFLTDDEFLKANIHNSIGYNYLRKQEFNKSIPQFQKALAIDPGFGYALDNLGFAFIITGDLMSGKYYLDLAMQAENNNISYSYRNLALYHQEKGEIEWAEEYFKKALASNTPVDLLEYFYGKFLLDTARIKEGMDYLKIAAEKKEPEAIRFIKELSQQQNKDK